MKTRKGFKVLSGGVPPGRLLSARPLPNDSLIIATTSGAWVGNLDRRGGIKWRKVEGTKP